MHKAREPNSIPPFRTIVSSIGTYNYEHCALDTFTFGTYNYEHCVLDTFTFVREINELPLSGNFDVESLFKNIPLEECVNLAVDYISKATLTKTELSIQYGLLHSPPLHSGI